MPRVRRSTGRLSCIAILLALFADGAHAQAALWSIAIDAADDAGCISSDELSQRVVARAGSSATLADPVATLIRIEIRERREARAWFAEIRTVDPIGHTLGLRELSVQAESCRALDAPLALVVAAIVGVHAARPPPRPPPEAASEVLPKQSSKTRADESPRHTVSTPGVPWHFDLEMGVRVVSGLMEEPAVGFRAGFSASRAALQLIGAALWLPEGEARLAAAAETRFSAMLGELAICAFAARFEQGGFAFCGGVQAGAIWDRTSGLWTQRASQQLLLQGTPSVQVQLGLAPTLLLSAAVGANFPLVYPRYGYRADTDELRTYHVVEMGLWAGVGMALRIGS